MARADIDAVAAADALGDVHSGEVVLDDDSVGRALSLALHTADAAEVAHLHDLCALVHIAAGGHDLLAFGDQLYDALGAGIGTGAAAHAAHTIDLGNAVNDMYRVELAGSGAVAETDAGEGAGLVALAAEEHGGLAVDGAGVVEALLRVTLGAGAGYESDHLFHIAAGDTHDLCDLCGSLSAARNAAVGGSFARGDSGSIAVTAAFLSCC